MKKTTDQPLTELADAAFEQAAQKVIERARQSGTPVIVWEGEAVKEVDGKPDDEFFDEATVRDRGTQRRQSLPNNRRGSRRRPD